MNPLRRSGELRVFRRLGRSRRLGWTVLLPILGACGTQPASTGDDGPALPDAPAWFAASSSGVGVTVLPSTDPPQAGLLRLTVSLDGAGADQPPPTLDVVSPDMPMHGVVRYPTKDVGSGRFQGEVELPMAGYWELYVNLDQGRDAAVFPIDVRPGASPSGHAHGHDATQGSGGEANTPPEPGLEGPGPDAGHTHESPAGHDHGAREVDSAGLLPHPSEPALRQVPSSNSR